ncbi:hypothetical protein BDV96DRAFT_484516 [Lophiotrema nucula]|uniref:Homeobox domain-containing protein n=1 Tax=Lophiotrema nucula TaxID=690887 RepID=A0A6A5ZRT4_9PLEO|nr:hypothetical protein BDV96DRAFT_484516 [Lophiotrema nucula]
MRSYAGQDRPQSQPASANGAPKPATGPLPKQHHNGCADVKPRLTKDQHDILESHFQQQHKPSTSTKKGFAEALGNWFQNRRAKVKQDLKKQLNQYNMNMGIYGPTPHQMPIVNSQYQQTEQSQPQPPTNQDFYPVSVNADISPTCLPVQSVEGPSALELGSQLSLHPPFDMHSGMLRSIPEADRSTLYHPNAVMQSFMAATAGASFMQNSAASLPAQESGFSYDTTGLPQSFPGDLAFSIPSSLPNDIASSNEVYNSFSDLSGFDYASLTATTTSGSADVQNSTGSLSSEPSPFSGTQSTATTQSSGGPNASSVTSIASVYSGWTDENAGGDMKPANHDDSFDSPYAMPQASASEQALPFWAQHGHSQSFSQADMYQHSNASAQAILSSPGQTDARTLSAAPSDLEVPTLGDDIYSRRNSSTTNLANNIEAIHIQGGHTPEGFKQPSQPSSIAARRHKRPTALNPTTLRSASYTGGMPSPGGNNEHTLRRIRSSGIANPGRVQKSTPGSAQRSPMTLTFADAAASPKFARTFSSSSTATVGQGGSLAPPTPLTPNEMARFPYWQSNTVIRSHAPMPEHSSPESLNANWTVEPQSAGVHTSPPSTPLDLRQINQARFANDSLYRDTPPQSAPATQQSFPRTSFMPPPQLRSGFHSSTDLTIAQPKPSHFRRPSLPDGGHTQLDDPHIQFPVQYGDSIYDQKFQDISLEGISHNVPFAPPLAMPEFLVHEYTPPHGMGGPPTLYRRTTEPQPKSYIFANQGPRDFKA